ncbi:NusA-like transcription termination signal-binding factor [Halorubellus sp. JP-L1]|uniref:NusA-like transcription termination signal-binding factor n=1 Tax=Halorubellus sp. JP-L1 TaxID=2715753 RepID=UPI00140A7B9D|nr:NusA-like transcription termination signal-binding factor [Halorubellus sp. JP-L1]NHN41566.1 NusA-like transcription termination signal-binding factor [Halorubellus sp. JP-L1]
MARTLSDEARRVLALFEDVTGATGLDCVVYEDRVVVLVARGDMGEAIGPGGEHVAEFEERLGTAAKLVETADSAADFVANALAPAAVYNVTISENGDTVAYVEVDEADTGVAIGADGRNIEAARDLSRRHVDVDDIELT